MQYRVTIHVFNRIKSCLCTFEIENMRNLHHFILLKYIYLILYNVCFNE